MLSIYRAALAVIIIGFFGGGTPDAWARGLSAGVRIQKELFKPKAPEKRRIYQCFKQHPDGGMVMGLCSDATRSEDLNRMPAESLPPPPPLTAPVAPPPRPAVKPGPPPPRRN